MSEVDQRSGGRRRVFVVATSVGAGAFIGAALFAGVEGLKSPASGLASAETQPTSAANQNVASADAVYDARTIYEKDSPGVVDITVTEAASTQSGGGLSPFGPGDGCTAGTGRGDRLRLRQAGRHRHRFSRRQRRHQDHCPLQGRDEGEERRSSVRIRRATRLSFVSPRRRARSHRSR